MSGGFSARMFLPLLFTIPEDSQEDKRNVTNKYIKAAEPKYSETLE